MQNFVFVHKRDGIKQVPDDEGSAFLTETGSGWYDVVELSVAAEFENRIKAFLVSEESKGFYYVGVVQESLNLQLSRKLNQEVFLEDLFLLHHFEGHDHARANFPVWGTKYRARLTVPNLPSPNLRITLKLSRLRPFPASLKRSGERVWLRINEGRVFSDLYVCSCCSFVAVVEEVSFRFKRWLVRPPELRALKKAGSFLWSFELFLWRFWMEACGWRRSSPGLKALEGRGLYLRNSSSEAWRANIWCCCCCRW